MKRNIFSILSILASVLVVGTLSVLTSCDKGPELTKQERATKLLTQGGGTWTPGASSITMDGIDVTTEFFDGFSITFGEGTFSTAGNTAMWDEQDTWTFADKTATKIIRGSDNRELTVLELTKTKLVFTMEWDQTTTKEEGGRKKSLPGTYTFELTK